MPRLRTCLLLTILPLLGACSSSSPVSGPEKVVVSVKEQKLVLVRGDKAVRSYPVSTSKFGLGDRPGSYATPIGRMRVAEKIGQGAPNGAVFKSRRPTGEVLPPNAPGRDPIVSRILWLDGIDASTKNARRRNIYIHGTPEEKTIGTPASYGCIRMKSTDVIDLFNRLPVGAEVVVTTKKLPRSLANIEPEPAFADGSTVVPVKGRPPQPAHEAAAPSAIVQAAPAPTPVANRPNTSAASRADAILTAMLEGQRKDNSRQP